MIIQSHLPEFEGTSIDVAPLPQSIDQDGRCRFVDNGRPEYRRMKPMSIYPDCIVLCTGYVQAFNYLDQESEVGYSGPEGADVRQIWKRDDHTVGYIGFVRPSLGAIPPLAEMQAQLWTTRLLAPERFATALHPENESHYRLRHSPSARIKYGVDHESYVYQLGLDMASAPGLLDVIRLTGRLPRKLAWRLVIIWAFGANFNTKFRLMGPWRLDGAAHLLTTDEFWETITRRPILFGNRTSLLSSDKKH